MTTEAHGILLPPRYAIVRALGAGATAEVLLAEDCAEPPRLKVVKVLRRDLPPMFLAGFRGEFRALASLLHPGLARVFEFGEIPDGRAFYTAEFVEGRDLSCDPAPSIESVALAIAAVCRALAYIHARGYVHNDIKPANILVAEAPEAARLLDFGLAGLERATIGAGIALMVLARRRRERPPAARIPRSWKTVRL